ncbi:MAG: L,D-transpeptidase [Candidatus Nanopelagicales bacterium]
MAVLGLVLGASGCSSDSWAGESPGDSATTAGGFPSAPPTASVTTAPAEPAEPRSPAEPRLALPGKSGEGRRIVWSKSANLIWLVTASEKVSASFAIADNDRKTPLGTYEIHRRNASATSLSGAKLAYFLGFYRRPGHTAWIALHAIPTRGNRRDIKLKALGTESYTTPGCIYESLADAKLTWKFATPGTKVVVVK